MSAERRMSFRESLPPHARDWLWIPVGTVTLTGPMPDGPARLFHVKHCPPTKTLAHNVAQVWTVQEAGP